MSYKFRVIRKRKIVEDSVYAIKADSQEEAEQIFAKLIEENRFEFNSPIIRKEKIQFVWDPLMQAV